MFSEKNNSMIKNRILFLAATKEEIDFTFLDTCENVEYLYTGIGKVNSAITLMNYFSKFPNCNLSVINIGTCGSAKYDIGEIISILGCSEYGSHFISQNIDLVDISEKVPYCKNKDFILSSDFFISSKTIDSREFCEFREKYQNFDMEIAAIAKVCRSKSIPLSSFKIVSDNLRSEINDWEKILKYLSPKLKEIVVSILDYHKVN